MLNFFDYFDTMEMINKLRENSNMSVTRMVEDEHEQLALLKKILNNDRIDNLEISSMKLETLDKYSILSYSTGDIDLEKDRKNTIILKNDKPLLKIECLVECYSEIENEEFTYSIYDEKNSKITNCLKVKNFRSNNLLVRDINIINKQDDKSYEYSRHNYRIYCENNEVIGFDNHNKRWTKGKESFEQRLITINNNISNVSNKIINKVNEIVTGEKVKEYEKKRKNK